MLRHLSHVLRGLALVCILARFAASAQVASPPTAAQPAKEDVAAELARQKAAAKLAEEREYARLATEEAPAKIAYIGTYYSQEFLAKPCGGAAGTEGTCALLFPTQLPDNLPGTVLQVLPAGLTAKATDHSIIVSGTPQAASPHSVYTVYLKDRKAAKNVPVETWHIELTVQAAPPATVLAEVSVPGSDPLPLTQRPVLGHAFEATFVLESKHPKTLCPDVDTDFVNSALLQKAGLKLIVGAGGLATLSATAYAGKGLPELSFLCGSESGKQFQKLRILPSYNVAHMQPASVLDGKENAYATNLFYPGRSKRGPLCDFEFNDCDYEYSLLGGFEQSVTSAQASQTNPFARLFVRIPPNTFRGSVWGSARFLGAPTTSDTLNVTAAISDPSGTITSGNLKQITNSVDYALGYQYDFWLPDNSHPSRGQFTPGVIAYWGATTPLDSTGVASAFAVPAAGTNECSQLQGRFGTKLDRLLNTKAYLPPLPASGTVITTVTTNYNTANAVTKSTSADYCAVQPNVTRTTDTPDATTGAVTRTVTNADPITAIAFTNQDRSSFLLKWGVGLRNTYRWHGSGSTRCSSRSANDDNGAEKTSGGGTFINGPCQRLIADLVFGQDQAITGGQFQHLVVKFELLYPIRNSAVTLYAATANRLQKNISLPPLVLTPIALTAGTATTASSVTMSGSSVMLPSPNVFVLPLRQSDRDFYRLGVALNLDKIFANLFK